MTWHALYYPLKPGSEDEVGELFRSSGRPSFAVLDDRGRPVGRLLSTMVFVGRAKAVRVIEVDGELQHVAGHMSRQPEVREFERQLESRLSEPRDMRTPTGARAFFQQAALASVQVVLHERGEPADWSGLFYPVKAGHEPAVRELVTAGGRPDRTVRDASGAPVGRLRAMMMFVGRQKALRLVQTDAPRSDFVATIRQDPHAREFQRRMTEHLSVERDLDASDAARQFFADAALHCVMSRRHDVPSDGGAI
jgi:hypothetical protein